MDGTNFMDYDSVYATAVPSSRFTKEPPSAVHHAFHIDILLVFAGIVFMVLIRVWLEYLNKGSMGRPYMSYEAPTADANEKTGIQKMLVEDWIILYNKTFRSNPNRLILRKEHIANIKSDDSDHLENDSDSEDSISIGEKSIKRDVSNKHGSIDFQDIESGRASYKTKQEGSSCLSSSYNILLDFAGRLHSTSTNATPKNMPPIGDNCVICFEEFREGDEVVWSATRNTNDDSEDTDRTDEEMKKPSHYNRCQHVYHQDCMVQYLANHSHRKFQKQRHFEGSLDIETPCPTCRRNFCILSDGDISVAIKTRCHLLAETSSTSGDENSDENDSDEINDPESPEEESPTTNNETSS